MQERLSAVFRWFLSAIMRYASRRLRGQAWRQSVGVVGGHRQASSNPSTYLSSVLSQHPLNAPRQLESSGPGQRWETTTVVVSLVVGPSSSTGTPRVFHGRKSGWNSAWYAVADPQDLVGARNEIHWGQPRKNLKFFA